MRFRTLFYRFYYNFVFSIYQFYDRVNRFFLLSKVGRKKTNLATTFILSLYFLEQLSKRQYAGITSLLERYLHQQMCKLYFSLVTNEYFLFIFLFSFSFFFVISFIRYIFSVFMCTQFTYILQRNMSRGAFERRYYAVF